jgi:hypothetical protein
MKTYARVTAAVALAAFCLLIRPARSTAQVKVFTQEEGKHYAWLGDRLTEAYSVQVGMSRADLLKVFDVDGGLQRIPPERYILRSCDMIKVKVQFELPKGTSRDKLPPDIELKISAISKPYLERPIPE